MLCESIYSLHVCKHNVSSARHLLETLYFYTKQLRDVTLKNIPSPAW